MGQKSALIATLLFLASCGHTHEPMNTGADCKKDSQCDGDICVDELGATDHTEFPGGYCTNECEVYWQCERSEVCLPYDITDTAKFCWVRCADDMDCRVEDGYFCKNINPWNPDMNICVPESLR